MASPETKKKAHEYLRETIVELERALDNLDDDVRRIRKTLRQLQMSADDVQTMEEEQ